MAEIYLVRHAQGSFGSDEYDRLSAVGRRQAAAAGEYFRRTLTQTPRIISGSLRRQQETAAAIGACFDVKHDAVGVDARLNEVGFARLSNTSCPC
jgi:broad specificity phosphatase PhoE